MLGEAEREMARGIGACDAMMRSHDDEAALDRLLYGQLSGVTSLREIVTGLESHETRLYHLGAAPVKRSTMSDANSQRPWHVFCGTGDDDVDARDK